MAGKDIHSEVEGHATKVKASDAMTPAETETDGDEARESDTAEVEGQSVRVKFEPAAEVEGQSMRIRG